MKQHDREIHNDNLARASLKGGEASLILYSAASSCPTSWFSSEIGLFITYLLIGPSEKYGARVLVSCILAPLFSIYPAKHKLSRQLVFKSPKAILRLMGLGENWSTASRLLLNFLCTQGEKQLIMW